MRAAREAARPRLRPFPGSGVGAAGLRAGGHRASLMGAGLQRRGGGEPLTRPKPPTWLLPPSSSQPRSSQDSGADPCPLRGYTPPTEKWIWRPGGPWQRACLAASSRTVRGVQTAPVFLQPSPWRDSSLPAQGFPFLLIMKTEYASGRQNTGEGAGTAQPQSPLQERASVLRQLHKDQSKFITIFQFTNGKSTTLVRKWKGL